MFWVKDMYLVWLSSRFLYVGVYYIYFYMTLKTFFWGYNEIISCGIDQ